MASGAQHAARLSRSARLQRVHDLLDDGCERSTMEIIRDAEVANVSSAVSELRANGAVIDCRREARATGPVWFYRMISPAKEA